MRWRPFDESRRLSRRCSPALGLSLLLLLAQQGGVTAPPPKGAHISGVIVDADLRVRRCEASALCSSSKRLRLRRQPCEVRMC